jgi:hypothetical protein
MPTPGSVRLPWPDRFPEVFLHTDVRTRDSHEAYTAAKAGDAVAALRLACDLVSSGTIDRLRAAIGGRPAFLLPVIADETTGFNAIPDAMAQVLSRDLSLPAVAGEIVQTNKVGHTRARTFQRLVTPAAFEGPVVAGAEYVLIDDHVGVGGTLANLRGHIEAHGARVIAMTTLTESREGRRISLRPATLAMLRERHGEALDAFWRAQFGYGIESLTELEAQNLCRQQSLAAIQDFLAQAAIEARRRGLEPSAAGAE